MEKIIRRSMLALFSATSVVLAGCQESMSLTTTKETPVTTAKTDDIATQEQEKFKGTWKIIEWQKDGVESGSEVGGSYTFYKNELTINRKNRAPLNQIIYLDPTAKPAAIDLQGVLTTKGIYKFVDKDTLVICYAPMNSSDRPTEFKCGLMASRDLITFRRKP